MWYPDNKQELEGFIDKSFKKKISIKTKKIHGLIVPHAGYEYSGAIAGKAFSLLKPQNSMNFGSKKSNKKDFLGNKKIKIAIVLGPSHYVYLFEACTSNLEYWHTPLGQIKLFNKNFQEGDIEQEHSIKNQIPFLQKLGIKEIMPLMIGKITNEQAEEIAKKISKVKALYVFSTDLSHFMPYNQAKETDKKTIKILEELDENNFKNLDACGYFPLLIMKHLCKIKKTHPRLIEYKNSGDITGDKSGVVGYASFWF